ncbi:uncharacterized protein LOC108828426 isoform X1 [Raphanus sativus]|uniref:Uncharacterized protein LOC108828426 isoform X1 n=2 Tax=Raphanus sativus TaxID=3726 RepID=A0A6J0LC21_RAPSA|nr:uncharacterized protein LOC108828426 isoform X1 [Raphanus sativus]
MEAELLDWELVHGSDTEPTDSIALEKESWSSSVIDDGMILSHHFSPDNQSIDDESHIDDATECLSETEHLQVADGGEPIEDGSNSCSDSGGKQLVSRDSGIVYGEEEIGSDRESGGGAVAVGCGDESKSRETVWWKMPFVLVNYSAFRIRPVWSLSMAAALVGFLLLGRRLHNTKNKPQRIHLKVAIDYTKVSQVMSQAARLNQAFTEVRRVPVIRPALPAPGAWPVLSLR